MIARSYSDHEKYNFTYNVCQKNENIDFFYKIIWQYNDDYLIWKNWESKHFRTMLFLLPDVCSNKLLDFT